MFVVLHSKQNIGFKVENNTVKTIFKAYWSTVDYIFWNPKSELNPDLKSEIRIRAGFEIQNPD